jgi:hypothetical protein
LPSRASPCCRDQRPPTTATPSNAGESRAAARLLGAVFGPPTDRAKRAATAFAVAQLPYNAMIVRDAKTATALLGAVGNSDALDAIRGFADARGEARTIAATDWAAQYKLGLRLVDLLTKGGPN